jgi:hypothetical protein
LAQGTQKIGFAFFLNFQLFYMNFEIFSQNTLKVNKSIYKEAPMKFVLLTTTHSVYIQALGKSFGFAIGSLGAAGGGHRRNARALERKDEGLPGLGSCTGLGWRSGPRGHRRQTTAAAGALDPANRPVRSDYPIISGRVIRVIENLGNKNCYPILASTRNFG